jgi:hypothetical protein
LFREDQLLDVKKWLFSPVAECLKAIETGSLYPTVKVEAGKLLPSFQADSLQHLKTLMGRYRSYATEVTGNDDANKPHAVACTRMVFEQTICARTAYNPQGLGAPLLISNTPRAFCTAGFKDEDKKLPEKDTWPGSPGNNVMVDRKIKELFEAFGTEEGKEAVETLEALCEHIFSHSNDEPISRLDPFTRDVEESTSALLTLEDDSDSDNDDDEERRMDQGEDEEAENLDNDYDRDEMEEDSGV